MFKNYLTVALRNLLRHKGYSLITILGLAVGMAGWILICLAIQDELSYDRFHEKGDRIYRVLRIMDASGGKSGEIATTSGPLGPALKAEFPEVEAAVRIWNWGDIRISTGDKAFMEQFCLADSDILDLFSFPLVKGDTKTALQDPYSILMTEQMAQKYFGDGDAIGRVITAEHTYFDGEYTVTGILKDIPGQSTIRFGFLTSTVISRQTTQNLWHTEWKRSAAFRPVQTYVLLPEGYDPADLERGLPEFMARQMGESVAEKNTYRLQPLQRIYLYSNVDYGLSWYSDIRYVYQMSAIAFFLLLIACINFTNLATARSARRAQEVGLRKVVGATRQQLVVQFLGESLLMSVLALVLAVGLAELFLPAFNGFTHKQLSFAAYGQTLLGLAGFTVFLALLAGSYPAFFLSGFQPVAVMKGGTTGPARGRLLRKGLVVSQFAISVFLIVGTVVIYKQVQYMRTKDPGFDREQVVVVPIFGAEGESKQSHERLGNRYRVVKQAFLQHPSVTKATAFRFLMGFGSGRIRWVHPEGFGPDEFQMRVAEVDEGFLDVYDIDVVAGRNFSPDVAADVDEAVLLNETAVKLLGWTEPLGKRFGRRTVVGVVKDFHNRSMRESIEPMVFMIRTPLFNYLALKVRPGNMEETLAFFKTQWEAFMPAYPFRYFYETEILDSMYRGETKSGKMVGTFAGLAIFVACLGLFGLAAFTAEQRTKEIGVRKVLGASVPNIVLLLSKDFLGLVIVANLVAWPVAYYAMDRWLQAFAHRVNLGPGLFVLGGVVALLIALLTVGYQAVKAARGDPVDALRYE